MLTWMPGAVMVIFALLTGRLESGIDINILPVKIEYSFKPLLTGAIHCYSMFTECFEFFISIDMRNCLNTICLEILLVCKY